MSSLRRSAIADIQGPKLRRRIRRTLVVHKSRLNVMLKVKEERAIESQDLRREHMAHHKEVEMEIGGPSGIEDHLSTSSSDELLDPPITQVPATTPTSTRSSICSQKRTRKFESQQAWDIIVIKAKE
jgi:hypothetical protein